MLGCGWRGDRSSFSQSLSEPTADEPFRFLLGALGLESSSSEAVLDALSSSLQGCGAAPLRDRGEVAGALRRDLIGLEESSYSSASEKRSLNLILCASSQLA